MHRRPWAATTKAKLVRQGLQGPPGAALCHEYQRSHARYAPGRARCLAQAGQVFEVPQHGRTAAHRRREHARWQALAGELTLE
jgi:hypothetical protein